MSGNRARARRQKLRAKLRSDSPFTEEALRAFVAREIPSLNGAGPWTKAQALAIANIYADHEKDPRWYCPHDCGRTVARFGEQCQKCREYHKELAPVDWDSVGA
jgi:hypothetical protein